MRKVVNWWVVGLGLAITAPCCGNEGPPDGSGGAGHSGGNAAGSPIGMTGHGGAPQASSEAAGTGGRADAGSAGSSDDESAGASGVANTRAGGPSGGAPPTAGMGGTTSTAGSSGTANNGGSAGVATGGSSNGGTTSGGAGGAAGASTPSCGVAPYAHGYLGGKNLVAPEPAGPFTISTSLCTAKSLTVDPFQAKPMDLPASTAIFLRASQVGSYPALSPEYKLVAGAAGSQVLVVSVVATTLDYTVADSNWSKNNEAVINVITTKQAGASGPCADVTGITYSVVNHPETSAVYSGTSPATSTPSTSDAVGSAALFFKTIGTLAVPEMVQVIGAKPGCTLTAVDVSKQTGRVPVARATTSGTLTIAIGG